MASKSTDLWHVIVVSNAGQGVADNLEKYQTGNS